MSFITISPSVTSVRIISPVAASIAAETDVWDVNLLISDTRLPRLSLAISAVITAAPLLPDKVKDQVSIFDGKLKSSLVLLPPLA